MVLDDRSHHLEIEPLIVHGDVAEPTLRFSASARGRPVACFVESIAGVAAVVADFEYVLAGASAERCLEIR
jgi:hypothetical protein